MEKCYYVMYYAKNDDNEKQETFWFDKSDKYQTLRMAFAFGEEMKRESGKNYRILIGDHKTELTPALMQFILL